MGKQLLYQPLVIGHRLLIFCPQAIISGFIRLGLRSSLIKLIMSYMSGRSMKVKWRGVLSSARSLVGGSAQGTLMGGCEYIVSTSSAASNVPENDKFRYYDCLQSEVVQFQRTRSETQ